MANGHMKAMVSAVAATAAVAAAVIERESWTPEPSKPTPSRGAAARSSRGSNAEEEGWLAARPAAVFRWGDIAARIGAPLLLLAAVVVRELPLLRRGGGGAAVLPVDVRVAFLAAEVDVATPKGVKSLSSTPPPPPPPSPLESDAKLLHDDDEV